MIYKNKGSTDLDLNDYTKYMTIGLLNHTYAYKIVTTVLVLLRRLVEECVSFFSEW